MNFKEELGKRTEYANSVIEDFLPQSGQFDKELIEAMNYSVRAGGKRLRPVILNSFCRLFNGRDELTRPAMAAIEMLHTYSLVHDDLPAIDNDDYRRGMYTTHKKFGEATALLAGDGLLHEAYETFIKIFDLEISDKTVKALKIFGDKTGINGMLGGQTADVVHTGELISDDLMYYIYEKKTGALIEGSAMIGAALGNASDSDIEKACQIGAKLGLAFQIRDDILDIEGDEAELGKPLHSDEKNNKKTYVTVHGINKSKEDVNKLTEETLILLSEIGNNNEEREFLFELVKYLSNRTK